MVRVGHCDALLASLSGPCDRCPMDPAKVDATQIRSGNVRVSRAEFLAVWDESGRRQTGPGEHEPVDWYVGAVVQTCRWVAAVPMRTALCGGLPRSPVTGRACLAYEASIEAEWQAAQDQSFSDEFAGRPGWRDGVLATLRWAWCCQGPPPLEAPAA